MVTKRARRTRLVGDAEARWTACPAIEAFSRAWGEESGTEVDWARPPADDRSSRRAWMAADWLVRVHTPAWLDAGGDSQLADALRSLPEIACRSTLHGAVGLLQEACETRDGWWDRACDDRASDAGWAAAVAEACELAREAALDTPWRAAWEATDSIAHEVRPVLGLARRIARDAAFVAGVHEIVATADGRPDHGSPEAARRRTVQALNEARDDVRTSALQLLMRMLAE